MRSVRTVLMAAVLLFIVAVVLVVTAPGTDSDYGWFAYAPHSDSIALGDSSFLLTMREVIGWSLGRVATLLAAGALGYRLATRRDGSA